MLNLTFNSKKAAKRVSKAATTRTLQASQATLEAAGFVRQTRTLWVNFSTEEWAEAPGAAQ